MEQLHFITKLLDIKDPNIQILDIINKDTHKEIIAKLDYDAISLVAGLTNGELIAPMTYEETMTSDFFEAWFQKFLLPTLTTPSVIIMDNARFHRMGKLELLCEEFGYNFLPLPPYSPEYNPIEKTWAHIKKHLKKVLPSCNTFYEALLSCSCFN
ncbi:putative IS630-Spn1 transposase [Streptococcus pneumoniae]|nr:putative IS630-Spn1 transposase [Streptococcus pneumoniae]